MKNILRSEWTRSSHPSGSGPKSSSVRLDWFGMGLARPVLGSTQDVDLSLWSIKKILPFGATCMDHPSGKPESKLFGTLSMLEFSSTELCRDEGESVGLLFEEGLSDVSTSSF